MENSLPEGWAEPLLGEVVKITSGNSSLTKKSYKEDGNYIAFSGSGPDGRIDFFEHEGNAIILSAVGARCGKCFKARGQWTTIANTSVIRPFIDDEGHLDYLFYLLNNENFWPRGGTGQPFVQTGKAQKETTIPLPPLAEQHRIVAKLDAIMQRMERNKVRLEKIPALLKRFRQSVLSAAVSGKLTEEWSEKNGVSEEWEEVPFDDCLFELKNGLGKKPNTIPPGIPILRISAVRGGYVDLEDVRFYNTPDSNIEAYYLQNDDLLFTRYNGSIDLLAVCARVKNLKSTLVYPDKIMRARVNPEKLLPSFAELYYQSDAGRTETLQYAKSSAGQNGISGSDLKQTKVLLPSISEQHEIVRRVEQLFAFADKIEARYNRAKAMLDKLPQSILAKAFRGELVPQDPNDEPAEKLLERVREERGSRISTNRRPKPKLTV